MVATFKVSQSVWNKLQPHEQEIMRRLCPHTSVSGVKAFLKALRKFKGDWSHNFCATKDGCLHVWSGMTDEWYRLD